MFSLPFNVEQEKEEKKATLSMCRLKLPYHHLPFYCKYNKSKETMKEKTIRLTEGGDAFYQ
jgi:hypothetical protein